uniref:Methionyl-tRNA formyltransferase n=1 Tax=candidate division WOR-3 bacterium TaxID=2052148 RepID=A0A7C4CBY7_UNCW3
MRLVFFGTGSFAVPALRRLYDSDHEISCVVTAAPKPSGRGRRLVSSPVAQAADNLGVMVLAPADPHAPEVIAKLVSLCPDVGVLVDYGVILRSGLLRIPRLGVINIHPSLLPAYRGAAPIQRQIMNGESRSGVSLIALTDEVDAGDILASVETNIGPDETYGEVAERLAVLGAGLLPSVLGKLELGTVHRCPQNPAMVTRAPRISHADRVLDWARPACEVHNRVRALSPRPGAGTSFRGRRLLVLRTRLRSLPASSPPGSVLLEAKSMCVACGEGVVELLEVKPEGGRVQSAAEFCNGRRPQSGERLGEH